MKQSLTFKGTVFYASQKATANRLYKEGRHVSISDYDSFRFLKPNFVEINFDNTGVSYIHLTLDEAQ